jgi:release factor glutamine methyltransferase
MKEVEFFCQLNSPVSERQIKKLRSLLNKRLAGWPIAYLLGKKEFWSLEFEVNPQVLIPRPETELLVERILSLPLTGKPRLLDVGTGCGNIAIALARERPKAKIIASDVSRRALKVAEKNARKNGIKNITFIQSDLLDYFLKKKEHFEVIVSNPPYLSEKDWSGLDSQVKEFEPRKALVAGPTGLEILKKLILQSPKCLRDSGYLVLEFGPGQEKELRILFGPDWSAPEVLKDYSGYRRVLTARIAR